MSYTLKQNLLITVILIIIALGGYVFLMDFSSAIKERCKVNQSWSIEGYQIVEKTCIGNAGPPFDPIYLLKENKEVDKLPYLKDSCNVKFVSTFNDTLEFDLCLLKRIK